jgi:hypothetical protein
MLYLADSIERQAGCLLDEHFGSSGVSAILGGALALAMSGVAAAIGSFGLIWSWIAIAIAVPLWLPLWGCWQLWRKLLA